MKGLILSINDCSLLAGHSGCRKIYYKIRKDLYWTELAVNFNSTLRNFSHCTPNQLKLRKNFTRLQIFPSNERLKSVRSDILGQFIRTLRKNEHLLVITDRFSKMATAIPMKGTLYTKLIITS